ncbi:MAG: hypothetical protein WBG18_21395 [Xanthobacteraceae bacterium]
METKHSDASRLTSSKSLPKEPVTTLAKYDEMVRAQDKYSISNNARSESSVVKTISE